MYDVIIIGAGPAGMSAAIYAMRAGLKTLVLEKLPLSGGQVVDTYEVDNYPGLPGTSGFDLAEKFLAHAKKLGAEFAEGEVTEIISDGKIRKVVTDEKVYETKTVIVATGAHHALLKVPGEEELTGMGVSYCATCDGAFFRNKTVAVIGGGDVAVEDAIFLARGCEKVYLIHRRDELRAADILQKEMLSLPNVEVLWDTVAEKINGEGQVESIDLLNKKTGEKRTLPVNGVFVAVGINPESSAFATRLTVDEKGYIKAGEDCVTSEPGVFAAGDVRTKNLRQIITAAADGANAVTSIQSYLLTL
ncbi:MAG: thioredoxin-disulfide reductase [Lachnospiraceae bacterium]|nr:thioredoxin-disulfide reductase [Lachnospiraceae bacterium]